MTDADRKSLTDARRLITEALSVRSEWGVLWRVRAEIDYLEGNVNGAIDSYQRALACSHSGQTLVARHSFNCSTPKGDLPRRTRPLSMSASLVPLTH